MNSSKITLEYIQPSSNIVSVAEELVLTKSDVAKAILHFMRTHPESSYNPRISRKLSLELIRNFLCSSVSAGEFAEEYGLSAFEFIKLASTAIDDKTLIPSDALADKIYRKLLQERASLGRYTPKRIIRLMASRYVSDTWITQNSIALSYGISRSSVGYILKRGVEEGILDDHLAEAVACKSCNKQSKYICRK